MTSMITIHTDGACSGNPSPGGFAAIIEKDDDLFTTVTGGDPQTTNNRMELSAVIEALRAVNSLQELRHTHVTVRSDSQYIVNAFNDNWIENWQLKGWHTAKKQPVLNKDLWENLLRELASHPTKWVWVRGHSGDPMNEKCDRLAVAQAAIAPSQQAYWVSAGTPLSEVPTTELPATEAPAIAAAAPVSQTPVSQTPVAGPDTDKLLDQAHDLILQALSSLQNGKSWEAADTLQTAVQQIWNHRALRAQSGITAPTDDLPF